MTDVQTMGIKICLILHLLRINICNSLDTAITFCQHTVYMILFSVNLGITGKSYTTWNTHVLSCGGIQETLQESYIVCLRIECDISFQTIQIIQILQSTIGIDIKCSW